MNSTTREFAWKLLIRQADEALEQGNLEHTEALYKEALSAVETEFGPNHPHTSRVLVKLADCYEEQGRTMDSHEIYRRVHAIVTSTNPALASY